MEEDILTLMARRNCHTWMRIMGREDISMFILKDDIQKKVEQVKYTKLQIEGGN